MATHDLEHATLAVILQRERGDVLDQLHGGCFDVDANRVIFEALRSLHREGRGFDEPNLLAQLERTQTLQKAGGRAAVMALYFYDGANPTSLKGYVADLLSGAARRDLAASLLRLANDIEKPLVEVVEALENELMRIRKQGDVGAVPIDAAVMVEAAIKLVEDAAKRGDGLVGVSTGIAELDEMIGGWEPGTVTILLGSPGVGKTAIWLQSAMHVARRAHVGMVQLEMTPAKMGLRALSNEGRVSFKHLRRGSVAEREWPRLSEAMGDVAARRLLLAPNGVDTWADIKAFFRRCVVDHGAQVLFLDNLKIVSLPGARSELERFNTITRELKLLSRALNVPIVAIHHMHRMEDGKRPTLTSAYGSSSFEQDADNVLALWRPNGDDVPDEVEVLPLKTRDDFSRARTLRWVGDQQRYESMRPADPPPGMFMPS